MPALLRNCPHLETLVIEVIKTAYMYKQTNSFYMLNTLNLLLMSLSFVPLGSRAPGDRFVWGCF